MQNAKCKMQNAKFKIGLTGGNIKYKTSFRIASLVRVGEVD